LEIRRIEFSFDSIDIVLNKNCFLFATKILENKQNDLFFIIWDLVQYSLVELKCIQVLVKLYHHRNMIIVYLNVFQLDFERALELILWVDQLVLILISIPNPRIKIQWRVFLTKLQQLLHFLIREFSQSQSWFPLRGYTNHSLCVIQIFPFVLQHSFLTVCCNVTSWDFRLISGIYNTFLWVTHHHAVIIFLSEFDLTLYRERLRSTVTVISIALTSSIVWGEVLICSSEVNTIIYRKIV
jgi:hypothetical protein